MQSKIYSLKKKLACKAYFKMLSVLLANRPTALLLFKPSSQLRVVWTQYPSVNVKLDVLRHSRNPAMGDMLTTGQTIGNYHPEKPCHSVSLSHSPWDCFYVLLANILGNHDGNLYEKLSINFEGS